MDIFSITFFTAWFVYIALLIWIIIGAKILTPFISIINKIEPMDCVYYNKTDAFRQIIVWPYMLFKIHRYNKEKKS